MSPVIIVIVTRTTVSTVMWYVFYDDNQSQVVHLLQSQPNFCIDHWH